MSSIPDVCVTSEGRVQDAQSANLLRVLALGLDNEKLGVCIKTKSRSLTLTVFAILLLALVFLQAKTDRFCVKHIRPYPVTAQKKVFQLF